MSDEPQYKLFQDMSAEEQAAVRMWFALGLTVEVTMDHPEKGTMHPFWARMDMTRTELHRFNHPHPQRYYRLAAP